MVQVGAVLKLPDEIRTDVWDPELSFLSCDLCEHGVRNILIEPLFEHQGLESLI